MNKENSGGVYELLMIAGEYMIGDNVFDNIHKNGIPFDAWKKDLGISENPDLFKVIFKDF